MTPEQNKTIYRAISIFGAKNQKMQAVEELMELQRAIFENVHRGTDNRENIVEEIADVEIMLSQLKQIFEIKEEELAKIKDYKLERLDGTISKYICKHKNEPSLQEAIQIDRLTSRGRE